MSSYVNNTKKGYHVAQFCTQSLTSSTLASLSAKQDKASEFNEEYFQTPFL